MKKLKFYTTHINHDSLKHIALVPMIHPFFRTEVPSVDRGSLYSLIFDSYWQSAHSYFELTSLEECDIVVLPYDWRRVRGNDWLPNRTFSREYPIAREIKDLSLQIYKAAKAKNKPVVVFFQGDRSHEKIPLKQATVFREGLYQSRRTLSDFVLPAFSEDLIKIYCQGNIVVRSKQLKPTVGFCGLAGDWKWSDLVRLGLYQTLMLATQGRPDVPPRRGENLRTQALGILAKHPAIETNFILRKKNVFLAVPMTRSGKNIVSSLSPTWLEATIFFAAAALEIIPLGFTKLYAWEESLFSSIQIRVSPTIV